MLQIRNGAFETNSSSVHAICISREPVRRYPKKVVFSAEEYGWGPEHEGNTANYLYTALLCIDNEEMLAALKAKLEALGIEVIYEPPRKSQYGWNSYYIDHYDEVWPLLNALFSNDDLLMRYLFSEDSHVNIGNDNTGDDDGSMFEHEAELYDWDTRTLRPNPYHHPDKFEYFEKGN